MQSRVLSLPVRDERAAEKNQALRRIAGKSPAITEMRQQIVQYSRFPFTPVLISGETGTGKELVVNALHACSTLANNPLIKVNCSTLPENLFESVLFGHTKGAFSGAHENKRGIIHEADGGILFLDEIATLKPEFQPKLLRFLENGAYYQLGNPKAKRAKVWVIAATNEDLAIKAKLGHFRLDLLHRIKSLSIELPPLRERIADITLLIECFMSQNKARRSLDFKMIRPEVYKKLISYHWPGNVRELKQLTNSLQIAVRDSWVQLAHLPAHIIENDFSQNNSGQILTLSDLEKSHIAKVLKIPDISLRKKALMLGISRSTLQRKLEEYGLC